jgi:hypothetical protein
MKILRLIRTFIIITTLGLFASSAYSADRIVIDELDSNGAFAPMYARIIDNLESDYVPIVFYRPPNCVNPAFDLLLYFDVPAAFFCTPLTIEGFAIFEDFAPGVPPFQQNFKGDNVPFVFVERAVYNMIATDGLTIGDLYEYGLWGTATSYKEVLSPKPGPAQVGFVNIQAKGMLDDETPFSFHVVAQVFGDFPNLVPQERKFSLNFD